jgi:curli biogenesis system outer membrane secretion channel CsgG
MTTPITVRDAQSTASYDATLNGKVLDLAVREAVDRLVAGLDSGAWKPVRP